MVVLAANGLRPQHVIDELRRREGLSGLEEFALRVPGRRPGGPDGEDQR
jgi:phosphoribosyl-ATP pyrophosphohydrolase